eukprot:6200261-Pleurochrysis_carterae.AAC.2
MQQSGQTHLQPHCIRHLTFAIWTGDTYFQLRRQCKAEVDRLANRGHDGRAAFAPGARCPPRCAGAGPRTTPCAAKRKHRQVARRLGNDSAPPPPAASTLML